MNRLLLTTEQTMRLFHACLWLRLTGKRLPVLYLKRFLVARLSREAPDLATLVEQLSDDELEIMQDELKNRQLHHERLLSY